MVIGTDEGKESGSDGEVSLWRRVREGSLVKSSERTSGRSVCVDAIQKSGLDSGIMSTKVLRKDCV